MMMLMQQQNNIYNDMQNLLAIQDQKRQQQEQMFKVEQAHLLERLKNPRPASSFANNTSQTSGLEFDLGMPISYNSLDNNTARMLAEEIRAYNIREQAKEEAKKLYEDKMLAFERKLEEMRREKMETPQQESSTIAQWPNSDFRRK